MFSSSKAKPTHDFRNFEELDPSNPNTSHFIEKWLHFILHFRWQNRSIGERSRLLWSRVLWQKARKEIGHRQLRIQNFLLPQPVRNEICGLRNFEPFEHHRSNVLHQLLPQRSVLDIRSRRLELWLFCEKCHNWSWWAYGKSISKGNLLMMQ